MIRTPLEFRILGPLEVRRDGEALSIGGVRQRALLALLLLEANRVVPRERLIDELSADGGGPMSDHAVRVQVSRLRQALADDGRLVARAPGYVLRVDPGELDLDEFEALAAEGRVELKNDAPRRAADHLREAESLWRGRPLADLEFVPSARLDIERLEELRLGVVEARIQAELALGRHGELVAELEAFVAEHPLREQGRAQLMLALYRSGRQVEALDRYRTGRAYMVDEYGLEPALVLRELESAILRQDPALELPRPPRDAGAGSPSTGAQRGWILAGVAAAVGGAIVAAGSLSGGGHATVRPFTGDGIVQVSQSTGRVLGFAAMQAPPTRITSGFGLIWASQYDAGTVSAVDPRARSERQTIRVGDGPGGLAAAGGSIWVANTLDGTVSRIDAVTREVVQTIKVGSQPTAVASSGDSVWVANRAAGTVSRIDAVAGRRTAVIRVGRGPSALAAGFGSIWVANEDSGTVSRIDTRRERVVQSLRVGDAPTAIATGPRAVWVADSLDATVSRIDPARDAVTSTTPVRGSPAGIAAVGTSAWVTDADGGILVRVGADGRAVEQRSGTGPRSGPVVAAGDALWVGTRAGGASHRGGTVTVLDASWGVLSIDPAFAAGTPPLELSGLTNDGLVTLNHVAGPDGAQLVPDLAVALPRPSADGRTYVFRLRPGIRYSTGATVRPADVRRTFERLFEMRVAPGLFDAIAGAAACREHKRCDLSRGVVADDRAQTVTFHLSTPEPEFLYILTLPLADIVPATTPSREARAPLPATGPYRITAYTPGREVRFARNPSFRVWSAAAQPDGFPDRIVLGQGRDRGSAATLVQQGRADLMLNLGAPPDGHRVALRTRFPGRLRVHAGLATNFYFLNTRAPPFDDVRVRRAFNFAVDRRQAVRILGGRDVAAATCQILPPQLPGYRPYCPYPRDPSRARRLVAASGTAGMRVRVWGVAEPTRDRDQGRYLVSVLRGLGYRATLRLLDQRHLIGYTNDSRHHAQVIAGQWGAAWPSASNFIAQLSCRFFTPASPDSANASEYCDPTMNRPIARAMALQRSDPSRSQALWARLDHHLTDLAVWLPLATPKSTDILSKRVGNYQFHTVQGPFVDQLWVH